MEGFAMLLGHMVGDFLLQEDFLAKNKVNPWPGPRPGGVKMPDGSPVVSTDLAHRLEMWDAGLKLWWVGNLACTVHCVVYALACWLFCCAWMPWWGALIVAVAHWPIDRFRLPKLVMERVTNQRAFANGVFAPWSVIVVDQSFHLLTLYGVWLLCKWVTP